MTTLKAFLEAQHHRHRWSPVVSADDVPLFDRCECGAVRKPVEVLLELESRLGPNPPATD